MLSHMHRDMRYLLARDMCIPHVMFSLCLFTRRWHIACREVIETWLEKSTTSPLTGLELPHRTLMENTAVKNAIAATMKQRLANKR